MDLEKLKRRMHSGELYCCDEPTIAAEQMLYLDKLFAYNQLPPSRTEEKQTLLKEMFAEIREGCYIETPFHANWGGKNVHFWKNIYANFNLTLVDDSHIYVGNHVMMAPNVVLAGGTHPIHPELRKKQVQYNLPVKIEDNVWLGTGVIVLPGVTIGENSVIGAGSVVTKDIPKNVIAVGNPCRVLREINADDLMYYEKKRLIDL